jgi:two-component sensor histidine kinase
MVLNELATNAAKYGALSSNNGRVLIRWDRRLNGHPLPNLVLEWREVGGPRVDAPGKSSYGTSTIHDLISYEFGGTVDLVSSCTVRAAISCSTQGSAHEVAGNSFARLDLALAASLISLAVRKQRGDSWTLPPIF